MTKNTLLDQRSLLLRVLALRPNRLHRHCRAASFPTTQKPTLSSQGGTTSASSSPQPTDGSAPAAAISESAAAASLAPSPSPSGAPLGPGGAGGTFSSPMGYYPYSILIQLRCILRLHRTRRGVLLFPAFSPIQT